MREGGLADAALIAAHRRAMFFDMWRPKETALDAMTGDFLPWVERMMSRGEYLAWFRPGRAGGGYRRGGAVVDGLAAEYVRARIAP